jgi:two-component system sensor histidine kinase YesM
VENAIKHGMVAKEGKGAINIVVERKEDYLEIIVMDNGVGFPTGKVELVQRILDGEQLPEEEMDLVGVGLRNVYERIKKRCGEEYVLK